MNSTSVSVHRPNIFVWGLLAVAVSASFFFTTPAHAQTTQSILQLQIELLLKQISLLNAPEGTDTTSIEQQIQSLMQRIANISSQPAPVAKGKLYTISQKTQVEIEQGEEHAPIAEVKILPQTQDTYLNSVTIQIMPTNKLKTAKPWVTFNQVTLWNNETKIGAHDLQNESNWSIGKNALGRTVYTAKVFDGNIKIPKGTTYSLTATLSLNDEAPIGEKWTASVPPNGVVAWTETNKHRRYGANPNVARITVTEMTTSEDNTDVVSLSQEETIALVEQGIDITLEGAKLVLSAIEESITPHGNVLGASTDAEASMEALIAALSENVLIYQELIDRQSLSARAIVTKPVITVTSPNGGEQWDLGVMNTITWTPYGYNPDVNPAYEVTAYLERKDGKGAKGFTTVGKVVPGGKASIHWYTGELYSGSVIPGDNYYIRVVNEVTGASDRSDKPFSILPKPITLRVDGNLDTVTIPTIDTEITLSWETSPGVSSCHINGLKEVSYDQVQPSSGSIKGHIAWDWIWGNPSYAVYMQCMKNGTDVTEYARFSVLDMPQMLEITSPNGGEKIDPSKSLDVEFKRGGIYMYSVALYKNDQWKAWVAKDVEIVNSEDMDNTTQRFTFTPSSVLQGLGEGDNAGAIFKIYILAVQSDGQGYIEDKSDAPFSFVSSAATTTSAVPSSWKQYAFRKNSTTSTCSGNQFVGYSAKYAKWVGLQHCTNTSNYKLYMSGTETGTYYQIADYSGHGQDHCELINPAFSGDASVTVGSVIDVQNELVFVRSKSGEPFTQVTSTFWADLTTDRYACGVSVGYPPAGYEY